MNMFQASAGAVDITPEPGVWMTGFAGRLTPSTAVHDRLMARAVLLDDGDIRCALISCDLIGLEPKKVKELGKSIAARGIVPADAIILSCTHTHSGPASMRFRGSMGHVDDAVLDAILEKIESLILSLPSTLKPARVQCGSVHVEKLGYNRQDRTRSVDTQLQSVRFETLQGESIATLLNYALHPVVLGPGNLAFSGDFAGAASREIEKACGGICLFLQGASGDVDPLIYLERGWGSGTFEDTEAIGRQLAEASVRSLQPSRQVEPASLVLRRSTCDIPLDPPPTAETLDSLKKEFNAEGDKARAAGDAVASHCADVMLTWAADLEAALADNIVPKTVSADMTVLRLNDICIVGIPFETYTDIGLAVKALSKTDKIIFSGYTNGLIGYCPTAWAKNQGGYGANDSCRWFPHLLTAVGYGADDLILAEILNMMHY